MMMVMMVMMLTSALRRMALKKKTHPNTGKHVLCEPVPSKCTWTFDKSHFVWQFRGKMPYAPPATNSLWELAQSKWTSAFQKRYFVCK